MGTHPILESDFDCLTENANMGDVEYTINWSKSVDMAYLSGKAKEMPSDSKIIIQNVPESDKGKLRGHLTLSGFVSVSHEDSVTVARTPKVSTVKKQYFNLSAFPKNNIHLSQTIHSSVFLKSTFYYISES